MKLSVKLLMVALVAVLGFAQQQSAVSLTTPALTPAQPTGANFLGPVAGRTQFCYFVVTNYVGGSLVSSPACVHNATSTLSSQNSVSVSWSASNGAVSYDVLRTAFNFPQSGDNAVVASALTVTSFTDTGSSPTLYTAKTAPANGSAIIQLNNRDYTVPTVEVSGAPFYQTGGGAPTGPAGGILNGTYPNPGLIPTISSNTTGNAATATAWQTVPTKCAAGSFTIGTDSQGNAQGCTSAAGVVTATNIQTALSCNSSGGNPTAYTCPVSLASSCGTGLRVVWTPDVTSGTTPTLNVGCGPAAIKTNENAFPATALFTASLPINLWFDGASWRAPISIPTATGGNNTGTLSVGAPLPNAAGTKLWLPNPSVFLKSLVLGNGGANLTVSGPNPLDPLTFESNGSLNGQLNTFVGINAGLVNTTGNGNTFVGSDAGFANTIGDQDTFVGWSAGQSNTSGYHDTFLGVSSFSLNTTGYFNTGVGTDSGINLQAGTHDVCIGASSCNTMNSTNLTTIVGSASGGLDQGVGVNGDEITIVGANSGTALTTGTRNTFVGAYAGNLTTTGGYNAFAGHGAGLYNTTGSHNGALGYLSGPANGSGTISNTIAIGDQVFVTASNRGVIGNASVVDVFFGGEGAAANANAKALSTNAGTSGGGTPFFTVNTASIPRFKWISVNAESGANSGSDMWFLGYDDAGSFLNVPLKITRSSAAAVFGGTVAAQGGTNVLYRCTVAGTLRVGQTTTVSADCGTAVDTGLRVN